ncbi:outer membrane protein with beta-barrel domain [Nonlabens dokdonensis]|uniref:Outer membrane protein beta-barrel domain-containing protein n=2 Tax=Nonlabens dokdonensis TaxID=328515 RepID=L7WHE7_NONDD|nr:outer membrane beta-barrel protein [Nonlabens dokdonensis]AGC78398.1 hypothetical protein DDD_3271 [Nonlabens dokdonensis DSW-6]PZX38147.1 outer membrane protein with beta-barrel domain [Nonlabens dokdonensis]
MKKLLLISLVFAFVIQASAQLEYGVTAGINSSRFSNEFETINGSYFNLNDPGISLGGYANYSINETISLYGKFQYIQIGDRKNDDRRDRVSIDNVDYRLSYLSIPLNVKFFNKFYVFLGPQVNVLLDYKTNNYDFGDPESALDLGANLGFGYDFGRIRVESFFYQGFTNLFEFGPAFRGDSGLNVRNTYINFNVSYSIFEE